jgi:hypothetical protein
MNINGGIFYRLTFQDDIEPDGFLTTLSTMIQDHPEREKPTRAGVFSRMAIFASRHNRVLDDGKVQPVVTYLFLVEGSMAKLGWLVELLEQFGQVSFPLETSDWNFSSDTDVVPAASH